MISPGTPSAGTGGAAARHGGGWCRSVVFLGTLSVYPAPPQLLETFWRGPPSASGPGAFPVAGAALVACGWHMLALDDVGVRVAPQQPCPEGGRPGWETGLEPLQYRVLGCVAPIRAPVLSSSQACGRVWRGWLRSGSRALSVVQFQANHVGRGEEAQHGDLWGVGKVAPGP